MSRHNKCPVTVITGFLGSGKTTLLAKLLSHEELQDTAVIINEYGQASLDHRLIRRVDENTRFLKGGCVCCNMRDDLVDELKELWNLHEQKGVKLDRTVLETTGLADPAPILFSVLMDPMLVHHYYVDKVVCCVDAVNGELHLRENTESIKQIVVADKLVITKTDLVTADQIAHLREHLAELNPAAEIIEAAYGEVAPDEIFGATDEERSPLIYNQPISDEGPHEKTIQSLAIEFHQPLEWTAFGLWLSMLLFAHGEKMLRVKGMVDVGVEGPVMINGVQHVIHPPLHLSGWQDEEKKSQLVFIMKDILPAQILDSLEAFQGMLGGRPEIHKIGTDAAH